MAKGKPAASGMTGKQLVKLLRESGTGEAKLAVARAVLERKPKASAEAVFDALKADYEAGNCVGEGTLAKAEQIMRDGEYRFLPPVVETPIEDLDDDPAE